MLGIGFGNSGDEDDEAESCDRLVSIYEAYCFGKVYVCVYTQSNWYLESDRRVANCEFEKYEDRKEDFLIKFIRINPPLRVRESVCACVCILLLILWAFFLKNAN